MTEDLVDLLVPCVGSVRVVEIALVQHHIRSFVFYQLEDLP